MKYINSEEYKLVDKLAIGSQGQSFLDSLYPFFDNRLQVYNVNNHRSLKQVQEAFIIASQEIADA